MTDRPSRSRRAQRVRDRRRRRRIRIVMAVGVSTLVAGLLIGSVLLGGGAQGDAAVVDVDLVEFGFEGDLVAVAGPVRLSATNTGRIPHNIGIRGGPISPDLRPGAAAELDLGELAPGTYELYCDVADHVEQGMVATLVVEAAPGDSLGT